MQELRRLMYVEDDEDIQAVARMSLETLGQFEVLICSSGQEALSRVDEFMPDAVLLDVMMPGMDGPDTLRELTARSAMADVPAIFLTARADTGEDDRLSGPSVAGVIAKPFDPVSLPDQVRALWEAWHEHSG